MAESRLSIPSWSGSGLARGGASGLVEAVAHVDAEERDERAFRHRGRTQTQKLFVGRGRELGVQPFDQRGRGLLLIARRAGVLRVCDRAQILERQDAE